MLSAEAQGIYSNARSTPPEHATIYPPGFDLAYYQANPTVRLPTPREVGDGARHVKVRGHASIADELTLTGLFEYTKDPSDMSGREKELFFGGGIAPAGLNRDERRARRDLSSTTEETMDVSRGNKKIRSFNARLEAEGLK
jgi:hypothetical protein